MQVSEELLEAARNAALAYRAASLAADRFATALKAVMAGQPREVTIAPDLEEPSPRPLTRKPIPRGSAGRPRSAWRTPERDEILRADWPANVATWRITEKLNALPGPKITNQQTATYASRLDLHRSETFVRAAEPKAPETDDEFWSNERDDLVRASVQAGVPIDEVVEEVNKLSGLPVSVKSIERRAHMLGSRPPTTDIEHCHAAYYASKALGVPFQDTVLSLLRFLARSRSAAPAKPPVAADPPAPSPPPPPALPVERPKPEQNPHPPQPPITRAEALARVALAARRRQQPGPVESVPLPWPDIAEWGARERIPLTGQQRVDLALVNARRAKYDLPPFSIIVPRGPVDELPPPTLGSSFDGPAPRPPHFNPRGH